MATLLAMLDAQHLALADVKNRLSELVEQVDGEHARIVVTKHGRPAAALVSIDDLESLEETLDVLADQPLARGIAAGLREVARGGGVELDREAVERLLRDR